MLIQSLASWTGASYRGQQPRQISVCPRCRRRCLIAHSCLGDGGATGLKLHRVCCWRMPAPHQRDTTCNLSHSFDIMCTLALPDTMCTLTRAHQPMQCSLVIVSCSTCGRCMARRGAMLYCRRIHPSIITPPLPLPTRHC